MKEGKYQKCLIDSGGTDNLFNTGKVFYLGESMKKQSVKSASGTTPIVVGNGTLKLPRDGGVIAEE